MGIEPIPSAWKAEALPLHQERMADEVGFEPTNPFELTVFKTAAINHSATHPIEIDSVLLRPPRVTTSSFATYLSHKGKTESISIKSSLVECAKTSTFSLINPEGTANITTGALPNEDWFRRQDSNLRPSS